MALTTPIALSINAFDSDYSQLFKFQSINGDQVVANRLTIRDNSSNEIVYQETQNTYAFVHTLPNENDLVNGNMYNFYFNTINENGDLSENSNVVSFYCYTTPTLEFTNITEESVVNQSSYEFHLTYDQTEGELLNGLTIELYNSNGELVKKSDTIYSTENPPIDFAYTINGLIDNENYAIKALANTLYGTKIETDLIHFGVNYDFSEVFLTVDAENDCNNGRVTVTSNIVLIDGETKKPPIYIDDYTRINSDNYLQWNQGFSFMSNSFVKRKEWSPLILGKVATLYGENKADRIEIYLKRGIPLDTRESPYYPPLLEVNEFRDCLEIVGYKDNVKCFLQRSNFTPTNTTNDTLYSFLKVTDNSITVTLDTTATLFDIDGWLTENGIMRQGLNFYKQIQVGDHVEVIDVTDYVVETLNLSDVQWNTPTLYQYNDLPRTMWINEQEFIYASDIFIDSIPQFEIKSVELLGSILRNIDISKDITITEYNSESETPTTWDKYTIINCDFDHNINGGNVDFSLDQLNLIKIKRRKVGDFDWNTIYEKQINNYEDTHIVYQDYYLPSRENFEYSIVPCYNETELNYFKTKEILTKFDGVFVSDNTKTIKLYGMVNFSEETLNKEMALVQPYGRRYPVIISNPNVKYKTISVSGNILGMNFYNYTTLDRKIIVEQKKEWEEFLANGKPKIIKDWNGNIWLGVVTTTPRYSYSGAYGMGIPNITFTITEQGQYDNTEDLYNNGLLEVL